LFESELYGHIKGAFTGADAAKMGLAEAANGGDLFLDEIEGLPLSQQVKLLRFLETGEIRRVGAKDSMQVQTRVIVASNQPLKELVQAQKFREDLLFRLNGKKINIPPLRERREDIPELVLRFLAEQKPRLNKSMSPEALLVLQDYAWPGNVRELRRVCEQLALISPLPVIRPEDVRQLLRPSSSSVAAMGATDYDWTLGLSGLLDKSESQILKAALKASENDADRALQLLQISRSSFYQKIKNHKLQEST
jgi:DNA-binding NtrC family response regulator